ncbi:MAG: cytochrome c [Phycisphaerae bacterium]|nr:cytochrome c [Phycisphaerae bacterium]
MICALAIGCTTLGGCKRDSAARAPHAATKPTTLKITPPPGAATRGQALFAANCARCHGIQGEGLSKEFPIKNVGPDLQTDNFLKVRTNAQLVAFIERGRPSNNPKDKRKIAMPPKGGNLALTHQDIVDIVIYLRQVQKQHPVAK